MAIKQNISTHRVMQTHCRLLSYLKLAGESVQRDHPAREVLGG